MKNEIDLCKLAKQLLEDLAKNPKSNQYELTRQYLESAFELGTTHGWWVEQEKAQKAQAAVLTNRWEHEDYTIKPTKEELAEGIAKSLLKAQEDRYE